jgi:hypothetical protein
MRATLGPSLLWYQPVGIKAIGRVCTTGVRSLIAPKDFRESSGDSVPHSKD